MPLSDFVTPLTLSVPERLVAPPSWMGHTPFAFWIVEALRPRVLVELGVHTGVSYCAFCQAEESLGAAGRFYGVDHWKGDEHAGEYADEVYRDLASWHDPRFSDFSNLVRSSFDDAADGFSEGEIDLLHIDGLHTYEAVRHDFETWKDKLSGRGVVLFHDIAVRKDDFGVWKFWKEVEDQYPSFAFLHSNGLGVLGVGGDLPETVTRFFEAGKTEAGGAELRRLFSRLGAGVAALYGAGRFEADELVPQRNHIRNLEDQLKALNETTATVSQAAEERMVTIARLQGQIETMAPDRERLLHLTGEVDRIRQDAEARTAKAEERAEKAETENDETKAELSLAMDRLEAFRALDEGRLREAVETGIQDLFREAQARARLHVQLQAVRRSLVWRMGGPFRVFGRRFPGIGYRFDRLVRALLSLVTLRVFSKARTAKRQKAQFAEDRFVILESGLFDQNWYLENNPDVPVAALSALEHYLKFGAAEGRDPNPWFDSDWYLAANHDVAESGANPLAHYITTGEREGRAPNPLFATAWYRASFPDAAEGSALEQFIQSGHDQGRPTHPLHTLRAAVDSARDASAFLAANRARAPKDQHKAAMAAPEAKTDAQAETASGDKPNGAGANGADAPAGKGTKRASAASPAPEAGGKAAD